MSNPTALEALRAATADLEERRATWPCQESEAWTAEDVDTRRQAADGCGACPLTALCDAAARELRPSWGVWAAVDWGDKATRPKRGAA